MLLLFLAIANALAKTFIFRESIMKNKPKKAIVATIRYAGFEFEGLRLPDSTYAIAISQIGKIFQFVHSNEQRTVKRLLGKGFQFVRTASELNPKKVNILLIEDFGRLVNAIARSQDKAYEKAREIAFAIQDASVTTTLEMAYDLAFQNEQKLEEYQARQEARVQGKLTRRTLTDAIQDYINAHAEDVSDNYKKFIYKNATDRLNKIVFNRTAKKLREDWDCTELRDAMTFEELMIVDSLERLGVTLIDDQGFEPLTAVKEAGNRLLIKQIDR